MTHVAKPPKSEQVREDVSQEPAVSEQMWAVAVRERKGGEWSLTGSFWFDKFSARVSAAGEDRFYEARAVRAIVTVYPGQLEER